jgi:hypothetical protein
LARGAHRMRGAALRATGETGIRGSRRCVLGSGERRGTRNPDPPRHGHRCREGCRNYRSGRLYSQMVLARGWPHAPRQPAPRCYTTLRTATGAELGPRSTRRSSCGLHRYRDRGSGDVRLRACGDPASAIVPRYAGARPACRGSARIAPRKAARLAIYRRRGDDPRAAVVSPGNLVAAGAGPTCARAGCRRRGGSESRAIRNSMSGRSSKWPQ